MGVARDPICSQHAAVAFDDARARLLFKLNVKLPPPSAKGANFEAIFSVTLGRLTWIQVRP